MDNLIATEPRVLDKQDTPPPMGVSLSRSTIDSLIDGALKAVGFKLYGAILGDLAGQPYEFNYDGDYSNINIHNPKSVITDDTLLTLASANYLLGYHTTIEEAYKDMYKRYPGDHYGKGFKAWAVTPLGTKGDSYGNGCLMRMSPFMYVKDCLPDLIESVLCSHRHQISLDSVMKLYQRYKTGYHDYKLQKTLIEKFKKLDSKADVTVNFCLNLLNQTYGTHRCIEKAIQCGGDTDTNASIVGEFSNYWMKDITEKDAAYVESKLDPYLLDILHEFNNKF